MLVVPQHRQSWSTQYRQCWSHLSIASPDRLSIASPGRLSLVSPGRTSVSSVLVVPQYRQSWSYLSVVSAGRTSVSSVLVVPQYRQSWSYLSVVSAGRTSVSSVLVAHLVYCLLGDHRRTPSVLRRPTGRRRRSRRADHRAVELCVGVDVRAVCRSHVLDARVHVAAAAADHQHVAGGAAGAGTDLFHYLLWH